MKKSTILFTVLAVTAFLVATALGLQNPNVPESQIELPESPESSQETIISYTLPENNELNFVVHPLLET
ncbi:MAG: hypothetical protein IAX21_01640 [Candidatus Bathyarchaeota archaeon]|nr:hypothetical protein [Candidatus Bathyarchaeum tardum]WGM90320.1 MAG: hypothetical protein NUK63_04155 [Candidatus Bathyarchaeum tardum]WNZ29599.1 MAG: hypothetical protein IAX21_01640 [Candidatus Bathyarchaeota archaeon]